ncbi:unnamed protein product [Calypogeia fissa]
MWAVRTTHRGCCSSKPAPILLGNHVRRRPVQKFSSNAHHVGLATPFTRQPAGEGVLAGASLPHRQLQQAGICVL